MADKTIGELPALGTMEDDALIPVEHDGTAKSMTGTVLGNYIYGLVEDDVEVIAQIIATGPKGDDGVSPTLSSSKTGKVTTIYYTDAEHTTPAVLATVNDGSDGSGIGDMLRSTYDTDDNGIVDNAERLGGELPSYYVAASEKGAASGVATLTADSKVTGSQTVSSIILITQDYTITAADNGKTIATTAATSNAVTVTLPGTIASDFEIEVIRMGTGVVTISPSGNLHINGSYHTYTIPHRRSAAALKHIDDSNGDGTGRQRWVILGDYEMGVVPS